MKSLLVLSVFLTSTTFAFNSHIKVCGTTSDRPYSFEITIVDNKLYPIQQHGSGSALRGNPESVAPSALQNGALAEIKNKLGIEAVSGNQYELIGNIQEDPSYATIYAIVTDKAEVKHLIDVQRTRELARSVYAYSLLGTETSCK